MAARRSAQLQEWHERVGRLREEMEEDFEKDARVLACQSSLHGIQGKLVDVLKDQLLEDFRQNASASG